MAVELGIQIFADGADLAEISHLAADPLIKGFTTNPTLMRKASEECPGRLPACVRDRDLHDDIRRPRGDL